jgi:hypothetical protein
MPQICDMGQTAVRPLRRKACCRFFSPEKSEGFGRVRTRDLEYQRTIYRVQRLRTLGLETEALQICNIIFTDHNKLCSDLPLERCSVSYPGKIRRQRTHSEATIGIYQIQNTKIDRFMKDIGICWPLNTPYTTRIQTFSGPSPPSILRRQYGIFRIDLCTFFGEHTKYLAIPRSQTSTFLSLRL